MKHKKILFVAAPVVVLLIAFILVNPFGKAEENNAGTQDRVMADSITFWVTGDAMMHLPQYTAALNEKTGLAEFDSCYTYIRDILSTADVRLVNFETTMADPPYSGYPKFCAPREYADALRGAGFNFFVFANNHTCDKAGPGIKGNIDYCDSVKMWNTGIFRDSLEREKRYPFMLEIKGWKIAVLNCTYGTNGNPVPKPYKVNRIDTIQILADLNKAKAQQPDAIIMSIHWGEEYQHKPNNEQKTLAAFLFRNGVDVIVGSHPHVVQPMELVTPVGSMYDRLVIWSLGNFISNQKDPLTDAGLLVGFTLKKTRYNKPRICHVKVIPFYRYKTSKKPGYFLMPAIQTENHLSEWIPEKEDQDDFRSVIEDTRRKINTCSKIREVER